LKAIDDAKARGTKVDELDSMVSDIWRKYMRAGCSVADARRKDVISHYILRLSYCRTEELRRWLLAQESALFRHRFRAETPENQRWFLESNGLPYRAIGVAEMTGVREKLTQVARSLNLPVPNVDSVFYKVPFEEVPDLVASRRVYLEKGFAFVPRDQLAAIVVGQFRAKLSKALVATNRKWLAHIQEDEQERLTPVIEALSTRYLGPDFSQPGESAEVSLRDLDVVARQSFPLCMRHLFFKLREEHHLRHGGRMQLGLFLKGIGLRLEDALTFWRSEFSRKLGAERFDKEYAYSIRHNYGKEGKRTDYTPFSCVKVIMSTPGVGDHHGCPFKHFSEDNLRAAISRMGVSSGSAMDEIMQKTRQQHYQISCALTFEASQGAACPTGITHPNQYFMLSRQVIEGAPKLNQLWSLPYRVYLHRTERQANRSRTSGTETGGPIFSAGLSVAPLFVKINPNFNVVAMASLTVFAGCYRSVKPAAPAETMSKEHAMRFPIIGSCVLFSLFLLFKFLPKDLVNMVLSAYFVFLGVMAIGATILPLVSRFVPAKWNEDIFYWKAPYFKDFEIELTMAQVVAGIPSSAFCVWYVTRKHWFANNALGLAFSLQGIEMLSLGSFTIGAILLTGLFFYDIFWVFFTPVMVSVAKSFDAPIKLLFPTGDLARPFSLLGLGDIVIPGIFVALALRFDVSRGTGPRYFVSTFAGYMAGIITTIFVMNYFQAAQPALLYIVPGVMGFLGVHGAIRGELKEAKGLVDYERELEGILEKLIVECDHMTHSLHSTVLTCKPPVCVLNAYRYEEAKAKGLVDYERELEGILEKLIVECDHMTHSLHSTVLTCKPPVCVLNAYRYEEAKAKGLVDYERELEGILEKLIVECDHMTRSLHSTVLTYKPPVCVLNAYRYEEAKAKGLVDYERELEGILEKLIVECDHMTHSLHSTVLTYKPPVCVLNAYRYEEAKAKGLVDYERELEGILEKLIVECDRKIQRSFKRLEDEEGAAALNAVKVSQVTDVS
ncbi:unnamed protein product, partial [Closterium sp. NIES-54]